MKKSKRRCPWVPENDTLYISYHDREWGVPQHNDRVIFEFLTLEVFQAGLSWRTVLAKRPAFRTAFANFYPERIARFTQRDVARLLHNAGIIRNRLKIKSTITNAKRFLDVRKEFGTFSAYMWSWVGTKPINHRLKMLSDYPKFTDEALAWAKDLKQRGFSFLGPTVVYAHMQAVGMVNDHVVGCWRHHNTTPHRRH